VDSKVPFREVWTQQSLAVALEEETGVRISRSEVGRILRFEKLRPHRVRYWLHSPDPEFGPKAKRICDLYLSSGEDTVVLCVDEKPMQVLGRKYPTHVGPQGVVRFEYEYIRRGTRNLLGCFDTATGQVIAEVVPRRTADALVAFMEKVAERYPKQKIVIVWDNLNTHYDGPSKRWTEFNRRHGGRFEFVYTPIHASWMNQVEIWFSIIERRVLRYGDFSSADHLAERVLGFVRHWNTIEAKPFRWTWRSNQRKNGAKRAA
jgi:transposase